MDFKNAEDNVRKEWRENNIQQKIKLSRQENGLGKWAFKDGPPFANGEPHQGHVLVSTIKDTMARYHSQKGYEISYQIGFDCHGLPLEQKAEEKVGKVSPTDSLDRIKVFNDCCREIIGNCSEVWYDVLGQLGRQFEREETYYTSSFDYMKELWKAIKTLWDKDLIYVSKKVMPYSPLCETPLSNFEANSNYKERTDISVYTRFKVKDKNEYLVIWTTTPWSLLANQGICVNPDLMYALVESNGEHYWVSNNSIHTIFSEQIVTVVNICSGKDLEGLEYEPIFNHSTLPYRVYCDSYVKDDTGTGLVHLAPLFGDDDYRVMNVSSDQLPSHLIDSQVRFLVDIDEVPLKGRFVMDTALDLTIHLKKTQHVMKSEKIKHNYPHCWRTDSPLVYLACDAWFIRVQTLIPQILENNAKINWYPKYVGTERFANWIKSAPDWCFSRNRTWGTPIPIWISTSGKMKCIGDVKELEELTGRSFYDIHLDHIGNIEFELDGEHYKRTFGVLDCWFESGMAPLGKEVDFIAESLDQTRGWFYTLNVLSTALYNRPAYKNVIVSGLILAEDGKKMSKRLMNYTNPVDIMNVYGSDVLRLYLLGCSASKAESFCFKDKDLVDISRKLIPYANAIHIYNESKVMYNDTIELLENPSSKNKLDNWIYHMFHTLRNKVYDHIEALELTAIPPLLYAFIDQLCNTYIKLSRDRLKSISGPEDAKESLQILYYILDQMNLLLVPFAPHLAEHFNMELSKKTDSIHLRYIHTKVRVIPDRSIVNRIDSLSELFETVRNMRGTLDMPASDKQQRTIQMAYPLNELIIYSDTDGILEFEEVIKKQLNVKQIVIKPLEELTKCYKAIRSVIGKRYKKEANDIVKQIESSDFINKQNFDTDCYSVQYKIDDREGYISSKFEYTQNNSNKEAIVYLSNSLTEDNKLEGELNHVRRQVNVIRKEMGLKMYDRVHIEIQTDEFWSGLDQTLVEQLRLQLGGDLVLQEKVENSKTIKSLNGQFETKLHLVVINQQLD